MAVLTVLERRLALEKLTIDHPFTQFGMPGASSTRNGREPGSTGCTHTEIVRLVFLWTGKVITQDEISAAVGYNASGGEGLSYKQTEAAFRHWNLPYGPQTAPSPMDLVNAVRTQGPAMMGCQYLWYPQDKDPKVHVTGGKPNGKPNGYAISHGRTDLGFTRGHMVTVLAARWRADLKLYRPRVCDPDHGSTARPERPPFDIMEFGQLAALLHSGVSQFGGLVVYLPTRQWNGQP